MRKIKEIVVLLLLVLITFSCSGSLNAASNEKDNIEVILSTDKKEYQEDDKVAVDLSIKNNNNYVITLTNVKNIVPEGFKIESNTSNELVNQKLEIGETIHLKTELENNRMKVIEKENKVDTADNTNVKNALIGLGTSILAIIVLIGLKSKNLKKSLILLLSLGLLVGTSSTNIEAKENSNELNVEEEIQYNGNKIKLNSTVSYVYNSQDPKDPIEYQNGVEETLLSYILDEENKEITIIDNENISEWKIGEVHVLRNITNSNADIAIKIEEIQSSNNKTLIKYSQPDLAKVIKSIDYSGVETQKGTIRPSEGVTFHEIGNQNAKGRSAIPNLFSSRFGGEGSFNLFKKYGFSVAKGDIKFDGELCIEKINFDFRLHSDFFKVELDKAYVTLDSSVKLELKAESDFGGEKKTKIASFESYIGYGFFAVGDIFCYISANGEVKLEYTINATCGFDYEKGKFKGVWELDNKLTEAKADVNLKIGSIAEPKISFMKIGIVGGEFDLGRNFELKLDEISMDPIEYCLDAGYYNYASVSSVFLPGSWNKKFTVDLFGKDNNPIKEMVHYEEGKIVEACTRKFGALEGQILKHEGDSEEPLYLADISIEKDGKIIHSMKSGSNGIFIFDKVIEKGIYDIVVKSNHYETYKGKVEILGNRKNKIEKPIVLEPYKESATITGRIYDSVTNEPIQSANISVDGFLDKSVKSDVNGQYSLDVPLGKQVITAQADGYNKGIYSGEFSSSTNGIDIGLTREHKNNIITIKAGESYQFDFSEAKRIFVRAEEPTEFSSYADGTQTYHEKRNINDEYYKEVEDGSHWEIKVYAGTLTVFGNDGGFNEGPDSDINDICTFSSMNGTDPFIDIVLKEGETKTFDYQVDGNKSSSVMINCLSYNNVVGTEEVTDYYWNTHLGWDKTTYTYDLIDKVNFSRSLTNLEKDTITITSGEMIVYYYRLDKVSVY